MGLLSEVEPETKVTVEDITGGAEVCGYLKDLGIEKGTELTVVANEPIHIHAGPISFKTEEGEAIIARGWADKVYVEKNGRTVPMLRLEAGEKGTIKSTESGEALSDWFSLIGIKEDKEIEFLRHLPDDTLVLRVDGKEIKIGEGEASKILVEQKGKSMQANYLEQGEKAKVVKVFGGTTLSKKFEGREVKEEKEITLVRREKGVPIPKRGSYVVVRIGEQLVTIGRGTAEKVQVR